MQAKTIWCIVYIIIDISNINNVICHVFPLCIRTVNIPQSFLQIKPILSPATNATN